MTVPDDPLAPLRRWRDDVESAPIPASARGFAPDLYAELAAAVTSGAPPADELRRELKSASGTDRRSRALRILDRTGYLDRAVDAVSEARGSAPSA
jgi:hypothetical protein